MKTGRLLSALEKTMKNYIVIIVAALVILNFVGEPMTWADDDQPIVFSDTTIQSSNLFSIEELDNLLAPIALYPDPLLAQILLLLCHIGFTPNALNCFQ